ncbi:MAG: hypothetical protein DHS20C15_26520 [Planctomycetota bacterium]|nr:MAG: hypothetical protein DHS20C15_26520 [Planctomycetota bacterium]
MKRAQQVAGGERGFAIVAVLVVVAVMLSVGMTYLRHTSLKAPSSAAFEDVVTARETVESGLDYARQSVDAEVHLLGKKLTLGAKGAQLDTADVGTLSKRFDVRSTNSMGLGSTMLTEVGQVTAAGDVQLSHPDQLPRLTDEVMLNLLTDPNIPKTVVNGSKTFEDTTLQGLVILEKSCFALMRNVVVEGAVISRAALTEGPIGDFDVTETPCLVVDENFRIEPGDFLPDVAVVIPDGVFRTWYDEGSFQVRGDVSVHTVMMQRPGVFDGSLAYVDLTLVPEVSRVGVGLGPRTLSSSLTPGMTKEDAYMAILPRVQTPADLRAIIDYWKPEDEK